MQHGAITQYFDVAQLVLYAFWIFFAGLIYYLLVENHREGYPMDTDRGVIEGWPKAPAPKTYKLATGEEIQVPSGKVSSQTLNAQPTHRWAGSPLDPVGNPLTAGVGPGAWADRKDEPDMDFEGHPRVRPMRALPEHGVHERDFDPRGAEVVGADGEVAGFVSDLWIDTSDVLFRYLQVSVKGSGRQVLLPWNFARIRRNKPVQVEALYANQFDGVPGIKSPDVVTVLEEEKIQAYFGAGLLYADDKRMEPLI